MPQHLRPVLPPHSRLVHRPRLPHRVPSLFRIQRERLLERGTAHPLVVRSGDVLLGYVVVITVLKLDEDDGHVVVAATQEGGVEKTTADGGEIVAVEEFVGDKFPNGVCNKDLVFLENVVTGEEETVVAGGRDNFEFGDGDNHLRFWRKNDG